MRRNTLRGFTTIKIEAMRLSICEIAVHEKDGKAWAQLPSRPRIMDSVIVAGDDGKPEYSPQFEFDNSAVRNAFSDAVVRAVLKFAPDALEAEEVMTS
jgi:hypothetical protein